VRGVGVQSVGVSFDACTLVVDMCVYSHGAWAQRRVYDGRASGGVAG
jgi:hypothetical protein